VPGMASWWRGWPHRANGDGGDAPHWSDVTTLFWAGVEQASVPLFEGSPVLLHGCGASAVRRWAAQCHRADPGLTAQCRTVAGMASPGGLAEQRRDMIPRRVRGTAWRGFVFDLGAYMCQNIKCSCRGSRYGGDEPVRASSEAETRSRGYLALERGGVSLVRRCALRAKRNFARGWLGLTVLVGRWGHQDRGPLPLSRDCLGRVLCW
jgi:hypothetical protein